jgi:hypothetical protein
MECPELGPLAHIVVMQHVTEKLIKKFLCDLDKSVKMNQVA